MKKMIFMSALLTLLFASCSGNSAKQEGSSDDAAFAEAQPVESGEYRAVSFQDTAANAVRSRFDGRILFALDPQNSGIYVYENGNRTHFKASIALDGSFEKQDSIFSAKDTKGNPVMVYPGTEADTLLITRGGEPVKIAFERKPISELPAREVWTRISSLLAK